MPEAEGIATGRPVAKDQDRVARALDAGRIRVKWKTSVARIGAKEVALKNGVATPLVLPNDYVFVFIGGELPTPFLLAAIGFRADVRDVLVSPQGMTIDELPTGARIGSSSLRRAAQLKHHRRDLEVAPIRGNVNTRLDKLDAGDYGALVLASAGLERLGLADRITQYLDERNEPERLQLARHAQQPLKVTAAWSDGRTMDVTRLATYQTNDEALAAVDEDGLVTIGEAPDEWDAFMGRV